MLILLCPIAIFTAVLMSSARDMAATRDPTADLGSMGAVATHLFGGKRAGIIVYVVVYGLFALLGNFSYLLVRAYK